MGLLSKIKENIDSMCEKMRIPYLKYGEKKKFADPKRKNIYDKVLLSKKQIDDVQNFFVSNYGSKIPLTWHRHFTAFTGKFDVKYFPELLYIPEFERFMNCSDGYITAFQDKNILPYLAQAAGVKMPRTFFSKTAGLIRNGNNDILDERSLQEQIRNVGEAFLKPTIDSCSGNGCQVVDVIDGVDRVSRMPILEILREKGNDWVLQNRIVCHESIAKIYSQSVNTFRIMTYRWKNEIKHVPIIMRIGQGGKNLDNAHAGGMFIAVDDDGALHDVAFTEFKQEYREHPNTHTIFHGYKIEKTPLALEAACRCHSYLPQLGVINWDFTIDESGLPVLIEANIRGGSIWLFEMAHGCGAFGEKTAEILQWMKKMRCLKKCEWKKYQFGNMDV